jgi:hypothetical protein
VMIGDEGAVEVNWGEEVEEEHEQEYIEAASMSLSWSISLSSFACRLAPPCALLKTEAVGVAPADKSEAGSLPRDASV